MVETIAVKQTLIRINKYDFPYDVVRSRLEKIDFHTMEYVLECLRNNTSLLLKAVEQWSEEKNIHFVRLNSGTTRVEAHKFYRTNGYRDDKEQKRFIKRI